MQPGLKMFSSNDSWFFAFLALLLFATLLGFAPTDSLYANLNQYRMAGLAALEIAQKVVRVWRSLQTEWKHSSKGSIKHGKKVRRKEKLMPTSQNRGGAGCSTSSFFESSTVHNAAEDRPFGRPSLPWHGVYSLAVKWRQISEPCDPVVWINKLRYSISVHILEIYESKVLS